MKQSEAKALTVWDFFLAGWAIGVVTGVALMILITCCK